MDKNVRQYDSSRGVSESQTSSLRRAHQAIHIHRAKLTIKTACKVNPRASTNKFAQGGSCLWRLTAAYKKTGNNESEYREALTSNP
jgi:hypothetical protein